MSHFWLPELASAHGGEIDNALFLVHWLMLALFAGWLSFFLYVLWRFRRARNPVADYRGVTSHRNTWIEIGVAVAETVLLVGFSVPLWADRVAHFPAESESTVVRIKAEQFAWNMHYPGADGVFGRTKIDLVKSETNPLGIDRQDPAAKDDITTVNQLHLPVGKPAILHLSSKDVIHSFGQAEMRVKQDVIPGLEIPLWFTPTVTTDDMRRKKGKPDWSYEIACAQLCGLGHYRMRGFVTVHSSQAFQAWLDEQAAAQAGAGEGDAFWN